MSQEHLASEHYQYSAELRTEQMPSSAIGDTKATIEQSYGHCHFADKGEWGNGVG